MLQCNFTAVTTLTSYYHHLSYKKDDIKVKSAVSFVIKYDLCLYLMRDSFLCMFGSGLIVQEPVNSYISFTSRCHDNGYTFSALPHNAIPKTLRALRKLTF